MNDQYRVNGILYSQKFRKCGKPGCKCQDGEPHGPYWYANDGSGSLKYVGLELPEDVTKHVQLLRSSKAQLAALKAKIQKRQQEALQIYERASEELRVIQALEAGEHCDSKMLKSLGLAKFNGHEGGE